MNEIQSQFKEGLTLENLKRAIEKFEAATDDRQRFFDGDKLFWVKVKKVKEE